MGSKLGGRDFDVMIGDFMIHVITMTATINDASGVSKTRGRPNGDVEGEYDCSGEIEVDTENFNLIIAQAKKAGAFKKLKPFDIVVNGETEDQKHKQEFFGCKLRISDLLNLDTKGGETKKHKLPFDVTSKHFVRINGVPYGEPEDR